MSTLTEEHEFLNSSSRENEDNGIVTGVKELLEWKKAIKQQLSSAGLPLTLDQIPQLLPCNPATNDSILSIQNLAPLFSLYSLDVSKESLATLLGKISVSKSLEDAVTTKLTNLGLSVNSNNIDKLSLTNKDCTDCILEEVKTLRPEYLTGTWFNTQERPFKLNLELDWVNRMSGTRSCQPDGPMDLWLFGSTGDHIWDFISELHIHRSAMMEFSQLRDGWIEAPAADEHVWSFLAEDSPMSFIERMINVKGVGRSIVQLEGGIGGWVTFEPVRNSELTAAAARLLFKFSDPLYCARSDGRVVIKLKDTASRATMRDTSKFPSRRISVNNRNKFPF